MDAIHVVTKDGQPSQLEEDEIRALLDDGVLTPENLYWHPGMPEWRPLRELFPVETPAFVPPRRGKMPEPPPFAAQVYVAPVLSKPAPAPEPPPFQPAASFALIGEDSLKRRYKFRVNPVPFTIVLQACLVVSMTVTAFYLYRCYAKVFLTANIGTVGLSDSESGYFFNFLCYLLGAHVLIEALFLIWIYCANLVCRGFVPGLRYSPGWCVAYFFIPLLNLFRPYQVVQEIWRVSESPVYWMTNRDSNFVAFWFFCRLTILPLALGPFHTPYDLNDNLHIHAVGWLMYVMAVEANIVVVELNALILISIVTWRQVGLTRL